jgi:hypothetical protein
MAVTAKPIVNPIAARIKGLCSRVIKTQCNEPALCFRRFTPNLSRSFHDAQPVTLLKSIMDRNRAIHRSLPFPRLVFCLRQLRDVGAGILEGDEVATARQRYWIFKPWLPSAISHWRAAITPSPSRPDIGAPSAARLTDEQPLQIRQPNMVRPSICADPHRVSAPVVGAVNQQPANTHLTHFTEGYFSVRVPGLMLFVGDRRILGSSSLVIHLVRNQEPQDHL